MPIELRRDIGKTQHRIDNDLRRALFGLHIVGDEVVEASLEVREHLGAHGEAYGESVSAETLEEVTTTLDGGIDIETRDTARGTTDETVALREDDGRLVELLGESRGDNGDDTLVPLRIVEHDALLVIDRSGGEHVKGLRRDGLVKFLTLLVLLINQFAASPSGGVVTFDEEVNALGGVFDPTGGVDARTYLEDDVSKLNLVPEEPRDAYDGAQSHGRVGVEPLKSIIGKNTVFTRDRYDVASNGDNDEVKQCEEFVTIDLVAHGERLHEFEPHTAATKFLVRILAILTLGVKDSDSVRDLVISGVVIADDEVDAFLLGVLYPISRLDATIEGNDKRATLVCSEIDALRGDA